MGTKRKKQPLTAEPPKQPRTADIHKNDVFATEVWLISGIFHSLPGLLTLKETQLTFTALGPGTYWDGGLRKIEKKANAKDFFDLLKRDQPVQLFSIDLNEIKKITFPFIYFSTGTHLTFRNERFRLSFIEPNNTKMPVIDRSRYDRVINATVEIAQDIKHARIIGKRWRALLTGVEKLNNQLAAADLLIKTTEQHF